MNDPRHAAYFRIVCLADTDCITLECTPIGDCPGVVYLAQPIRPALQASDRGGRGSSRAVLAAFKVA